MNHKGFYKKCKAKGIAEESNPISCKIVELYAQGQYNSAIALIDELIAGENSKSKTHILMMIKALVLLELKEYETATAMLREIADVIESSEGKDICKRALAYYNNCLANEK